MSAMSMSFSLLRLRHLFTFSALITLLLSINPFDMSSSSRSKQALTALQRRPWTSPDGIHAFIEPGEGDVRSPCPALNTLANHGYINRSGKGISRSALTSSLTSIYRLSVPLAELVVTGGFLCCADSEGLSLDALAAHDKIEHDASLVHDNAPVGAAFAPVRVNWTLVNDLTIKYPAGLGIHHLSEARVTREELSHAEGRPKLDIVHGQISHGEAALTWLLMKDVTNVVRADTIRQWFGQETFPEKFVIPSGEITLHETSKISSKIGQDMMILRRSLTHD